MTGGKIELFLVGVLAERVSYLRDVRVEELLLGDVVRKRR
jgi:hypothetical protein